MVDLKKYYSPSILVVIILSTIFLFSGCQGISARFIGVRLIEPVVLKGELLKDSELLILDTRKEAVYKEGHISGSINLTKENINGFMHMFAQPIDSLIITVCEEGWGSQVIASNIMGHGYNNVFSLKGGLRKWKESEYPLDVGSGHVSDAEDFGPPIIEISILSQLAMTIAAFVIKPIYIILSLMIIVLLWKKQEKDFILLRYAMILFFIGENACSANYLISGNASKSLEFIHGLGMVGFYIFLSWGIAVFLDTRIIRYSIEHKSCVFNKLCKICWKHDDTACGLHRIALVVIPALAFTSIIPVTMPLRPFEIVMPVFLSEVLWIKDFWNLFLEFRVYPILGAIFFILAFLIMLQGKKGFLKAQLPFFLGMGFMAYSLFRFSLLLTFRENQAWADWWEETTELITVFMVLFLLIIFRKQLNIRLPWPRE